MARSRLPAELCSRPISAALFAEKLTSGKRASGGSYTARMEAQVKPTQRVLLGITGGIAAYKSTDDFAQAEVDYVTAIGGIRIAIRPTSNATA